MLIISFLILILPFLFRLSHNLLIGGESYYFLRVAEDPFMKFDELSYSGRTYLFSFWALTISSFSKLSNLSIINSAKVLSVILGLASSILFYFILRKFMNSITSLLSVLIFILSPSFLYLFNTISDFSFVSFFILLTLFFMIRNNNLAFLLLLFIPFFGLLHLIIVSFLLFVYSFSRKDFKWLLVLPIFFIAMIIYLFSYGLPELFTFNVIENKVFLNLISDFGSSGLSLFTLILSIFGLSLLWEQKYKNISIYLLILFLLVMMNFSINVILYLSFFISLIAALGAMKILTTDWKTKKIRNAIFYILLIGILFSFLTFFNNFYDQNPNQAIMESFDFLDDELNDDDVIFSHYSRGHWISYFSESKNFMDSNFAFAPDANKRFIDAEEFFYPRELEKAEGMIEEYSLDYIWLDKDLKDELWDEDEEGLQFLLEYSNKFKKIYSQNDIEIWRIE